ncbi:hypothetical protein [Cupriavidus sp. CuC1]|uniref:hypothetical protein n=1 Tax=Cupriavidus sp. CuC1 TaxID=3373131 RepID=UPI0037CD8FAB
MFTLSHANGQQIPDEKFLAAWSIWFQRFQPSLDPLTDAMPRLPSIDPLALQLAAGGHFSLNVLCRTLATPPYRNTMQATGDLMAANAHLLEPLGGVRNPASGRLVEGARLTPDAQTLLKTSASDPAWAEEIEALLAADIEVEAGGVDELLAASLDPYVEQGTAAVMAAPVGGAGSRGDLVARLVQWIDQEPFQPRYRGKAVRGQVQGWAERLEAYFWPTPDVDHRATQLRLTPLLNTAQALAATAGRWTHQEKEQANDFARAVFKWGGVPQKPFDARTVEAVFLSAIGGISQPGALMNSGWTKVAAFATGHVGEDNGLVIWDSRVAHSLIRRIDALLVADGQLGIPSYLQHIGHVPGRGGTRKQVAYTLPWPSGYRSWPAVFAGSALVREIRDELNRLGIAALLIDGKATRWTARLVEMVLFMDGY